MLLPLLLNLERRRKGGGAGYKMVDRRGEGQDKRRKLKREIELQDDLFLMEFLKTATYIINNQ